MKPYKIVSGFIKNQFSGKKKWQPYFEMMLRFSTNAMNYGHGSNFRKSGELLALQFVNSKIKTTHPIIFDVGANVGKYAQAIAEVFGTKAIIKSFEPSAATYKLLQKNIEPFKNIEAYNFALSDAKGTATLYSTENNSEIASLIDLDRTIKKYGSNTVETIEMETLDNFCKANSIDHIDLLKIDVEGFELSVLKGASAMLKEKKVSYIQFEFGVPNIDSRTYFKDFWNLFKNDYTMYRIVQNGLHPILQYAPHLEIFSTSNFLVEKK